MPARMELGVKTKICKEWGSVELLFGQVLIHSSGSGNIMGHLGQEVHYSQDNSMCLGAQLLHYKANQEGRPRMQRCG